MNPVGCKEEPWKGKPDEKGRTYAFLTTGSNLIEAEGTNARQAYCRAAKRLDCMRPKFKKLGVGDLGKVTRSYVTFGRDGIAPVGIYKQIKKVPRCK